MTANEDYQSLVQNVGSLDFSGTAKPCSLILTGDKAFPVVVSPNYHVLIAASRYGKGKVVAVAHESYLTMPQFTGFLRNAITWLKPTNEAVVGVHSSLDALAKALSSSNFKTENVTEPKKGLGVFCTTGNDDSKSKEIITFVREGGGLLIGADPLTWLSTHPKDNVLTAYPGNKTSSVAGIYFSNKQSDATKVTLSKDIPLCLNTYSVDFSDDLKQLLESVDSLDLRGDLGPSELLLHSPLAFPVGLTDKQECFFAAAYYGRGRVFVASNKGFLYKPELKTLIGNAITWLDNGRKGTIGFSRDVSEIDKTVTEKQFTGKESVFKSDFSVYCCSGFNAEDVEMIPQYVAEGGAILIGCEAWSWVIHQKRLLVDFPQNKMVNKFGIRYLSSIIERKVYPALNYTDFKNIYQFPNLISQLLINLKQGNKINPPVSSRLSKIGRDAVQSLQLPPTPLISLLQQELLRIAKEKDPVPTASVASPVSGDSLEAFYMAICHAALDFDDSLENTDLSKKPFTTVQINTTSPGGLAWRSTGLYLRPREVATFLFEASAVGKNLQVQVGCQTDNIGYLPSLYRAPVVVTTKTVQKEKTATTSIWGGLLYVVVPEGKGIGTISVKIYGAEEAPTFINGQTEKLEWVQKIRQLPAPWSELRTGNITLTVPSEKIRSLEDPAALLTLWDQIMEHIATLAAIPKTFPRPERFVADVQISYGIMHAGYPIMMRAEDADQVLNVENMKSGVWWAPIHELGHNQQKDDWGIGDNTKEATCNLWSVYVKEKLFKIPMSKAHGNLEPTTREERIKTYIKEGAQLEKWIDWIALELYLQLQEAFGWELFITIFSDYQKTPVSGTRDRKMNVWVERSSLAAKKNLAPFYQTWGWKVTEDTIKKVSHLPVWEDNPMKKYEKPAK